jgi:hypothetical protein
LNLAAVAKHALKRSERAYYCNTDFLLASSLPTAVSVSFQGIGALCAPFQIACDAKTRPMTSISGMIGLDHVFQEKDLKKNSTLLPILLYGMVERFGD